MLFCSEGNKLVLLFVQVVGQGLSWALSKGLGDAYTSEAQEAWALFYQFVTNCMKVGISASHAASAN